MKLAPLTKPSQPKKYPAKTTIGTVYIVDANGTLVTGTDKIIILRHSINKSFNGKEASVFMHKSKQLMFTLFVKSRGRIHQVTDSFENIKSFVKK